MAFLKSHVDIGKPVPFPYRFMKGKIRKITQK